MWDEEFLPRKVRPFDALHLLVLDKVRPPYQPPPLSLSPTPRLPPGFFLKDPSPFPPRCTARGGGGGALLCLLESSSVLVGPLGPLTCVLFGPARSGFFLPGMLFFLTTIFDPPDPLSGVTPDPEWVGAHRPPQGLTTSQAPF